jgi:hypothetical protein
MGVGAKNLIRDVELGLSPKRAGAKKVIRYG